MRSLVGSASPLGSPGAVHSSQHPVAVQGGGVVVVVTRSVLKALAAYASISPPECGA
jgi:hypothetical protein